jgi:hypothetical protein
MENGPIFPCELDQHCDLLDALRIYYIPLEPSWTHYVDGLSSKNMGTQKGGDGLKKAILTTLRFSNISSTISNQTTNT